MLYVLAGVAAGLLLGLLLPWSIPAAWSAYLSAALLAAFAAVLDGAAARRRGTFRPGGLLAGFAGDAVLAGGLAWLGDRLDVPLYLAAVVWFGGRIFHGIGKLREPRGGEREKNGPKSLDDGENQRI